MTDIDIGISKKNRAEISEGLKRLLADTYTLYLQTHNFHWNITGPQFRELHLMFEETLSRASACCGWILQNVFVLWTSLRQVPTKPLLN